MITSNDLWKYISCLERLNNIYERDFNKKHDELINKLDLLKKAITKKDYSKIDLKEVNNFCIKKWEEMIKKAIEKLLAKIDNRKTRGVEFSELRIQLTKLKKDLEFESYELQAYGDIYENDVKSIAVQIFEKLELERYKKSLFWKGLLFGVVLTIFAQGIIYLLTFLL